MRITEQANNLKQLEAEHETLKEAASQRADVALKEVDYHAESAAVARRKWMRIERIEE